MSDLTGLVADVRQAARDMDWFKLGLALDRLEAAVAVPAASGPVNPVVPESTDPNWRVPPALEGDEA